MSEVRGLMDGCLAMTVNLEQIVYSGARMHSLTSLAENARYCLAEQRYHVAERCSRPWYSISGWRKWQSLRNDWAARVENH